MKKKTFGELIRAERTKRNIALKELAERIDVCSPYICDIEYGRRVPSVDAFRSIVKALIPVHHIPARRKLFDTLLERSGRMIPERRELLKIYKRYKFPGIADVLWKELENGK